MYNSNTYIVYITDDDEDFAILRRYITFVRTYM